MRLPALLGRRHRSAAARAYEAAGPPGEDTPWRDAPYAVVDLETTGLDPARAEIISFASVPIDEGRIRAGAVRTLVVRPKRMPKAETIRIHGLRPVDLAEAPPLSQALDPILESLAGRVIVAHAAWVERGFLSAALKPAKLRVAEPILDTVRLAGAVLTGGEAAPRSLQLSDAARMMGLPIHRPHHADGDALTTAQLFLALASRLEQDGPQTVGSLARLSRG